MDRLAQENKNLRKEILLLKGEPVVSRRHIKVMLIKDCNFTIDMVRSREIPGPLSLHCSEVSFDFNFYSLSLRNH